MERICRWGGSREENERVLVMGSVCDGRAFDHCCGNGVAGVLVG